MDVESHEIQSPAASSEVSSNTLVYLASHGGPFFELQRRLRLLHEHALKAGRRALVFVAAAWLVPLLLGLPDSLSFQPGTYLRDPGTSAKFLVAIAAFILAEQQVERGLRIKLRQFTRAPLIAPASFAAAVHAVNVALRRRNSPIAELVCLILAAAASLASYHNLHDAQAPSWAVNVLPDGNAITASGWWTVFFSLPLFTFLFLRGLWRHLVWAFLLRRLAELELRLVATHPDGKGGLSFLADYPNAYALGVFGMSTALAAAVAKHLIHGTLTATTFTMMLGGWLVVVVAFFAYPLSAFSAPLARIKEKTLLVLGAQGTRYHRSAERTMVGKNIEANSAEEAGQQDAPIDPTKQFEVVRKMSTMLISRTAIVPVAAAALLPFAVVGATKLPVKEVLSVMKKLLLL